MNEILDASYFGEIEDIRASLDNGVDVNTTDRDRNTPLHMAALGGHADCIELLIERKANVGTVNSGGNTSLLLAVTTAPPECIELLLKAGAPVNSRNNTGDTPLDYAIDQMVSYTTTEYLKRHLTLIDFFLQFGADARGIHKSLVGIYQFHRAESGTAKLLLEYSSNRRTLLMKLLRFSLEPSWTNEQGDTLLHVLCRCDAPSADIKLLLENDFDVHARIIAGDTPLLVYLIKLEPPPLAGMMALIDAGADLNAANNAGQTPLQAVKAFPGNEQSDDTRSQILYATLIEWGADERVGTALRSAIIPNR